MARFFMSARKYKQGDKVLIMQSLDAKTARAYRDVLGKEGEFIKYYGDGDAMVSFGGHNVWSVAANILVAHDD